jgi:hypothetical protein
MAWTAPMTAVARSVWTSAQWNTHIRDNLAETLVGKASGGGGYFVTSGASAVAQRGAASAVVSTPETRSSAAYGDLTTSGPSVTVTTGSEALVWLACEAASDGAADAPDVTVTSTYSATSSATFQSDGTNRGDGSHMYQGFFDSTNGNQYSMALFPYTAMQSDMDSATVNTCELFLANQHFYLNAGGSAVIGTHAQTSLSGSHAYSQVTPDLSEDHWDKGEAAYHFISEEIAERIRDGLATGVALGKGPTNSTSYYGYFTGGTSPKLRINYTKPGTSGGYCKVSFAVSGATTLAAKDDWALYFSGMAANNANRWAVCRRATGLTPGSNTFTMKYAAGASGDTGTFQRREIIVMPL